ncbi:hypothetical protein C4D60_Mb08t09460 [Musa balbisiana]|uniref:Uncharacterized protein n=1 Tax=Musa balbisiana TaxID=52838 RepID=A0A4S8K2J7_MUSBA|nr:hypothetical protein C4D60_Mb08t09460 [Musa balbisiana]
MTKQQQSWWDVEGLLWKWGLHVAVFLRYYYLEGDNRQAQCRIWIAESRIKQIGDDKVSVSRILLERRL